MTTEIDAEGLAKAMAAYRIVASYPIVPANHDDALENAIRSYLAATRTSEAEPEWTARGKANAGLYVATGAMTDAALSAIEAAGWRVVPVEPTLDMTRAANRAVAVTTPDGTWALALDEASRTYAAMLSAAPRIGEEG